MHADPVATVNERRRNSAGQVVCHAIAVDLGHEVAQVLAASSLVRIDSYIADNPRRDLVRLVVAVAPLVGLAGRVGKASAGAAGWNSPKRFCRAASVAPRSALEAFTATSPIQMTAPLPLRSWRKPCA